MKRTASDWFWSMVPMALARPHFRQGQAVTSERGAGPDPNGLGALGSMAHVTASSRQHTTSIDYFYAKVKGHRVFRGKRESTPGRLLEPRAGVLLAGGGGGESNPALRRLGPGALHRSPKHPHVSYRPSTFTLNASGALIPLADQCAPRRVFLFPRSEVAVCSGAYLPCLA